MTKEPVMSELGWLYPPGVSEEDLPMPKEPVMESAEDIAKRIYLDLEGYLDPIVDDVDKKLIEKDIVEALESYANARLDEAAKIAHDEIDQVRWPSVERIEKRIRALKSKEPS